MPAVTKLTGITGPQAASFRFTSAELSPTTGGASGSAVKQDRHWCTEPAELTEMFPPRLLQATQMEISFETRIMRLSTSAAMAASLCWTGKTRARSSEPMIVLYLPPAFSARQCRPTPNGSWPTASSPFRPGSAGSRRRAGERRRRPP